MLTWTTTDVRFDGPTGYRALYVHPEWLEDDGSPHVRVEPIVAWLTQRSETRSGEKVTRVIGATVADHGEVVEVEYDGDMDDSFWCVIAPDGPMPTPDQVREQYERAKTRRERKVARLSAA